jgi:hypothetical protein
MLVVVVVVELLHGLGVAIIERLVAIRLTPIEPRDSSSAPCGLRSVRSPPKTKEGSSCRHTYRTCEEYVKMSQSIFWGGIFASENQGKINIGLCMAVEGCYMNMLDTRSGE